MNDPVHALERELRQAEIRRAQLQKLAFVLAISCVLVLALGIGWAVSALRPGAAGAQVSETVPEPVVPDPAPPAPSVTAAVVETLSVEEESPAPETAPAAAPAPEPKQAEKPEPEPKPQRVTIRIGEYGYEPAVVKLSSKRPIELTVEQGEGCAEGFLISKLGVNADNYRKDAVVRLGKVAKGEYRFTCGMEMVEGRLVVD